MTKRACYIHVGPHKTGTKSIQWFLKEHRAELLRHGYFVPESGNIHGGHHAIARIFCGQEARDHEPSLAAKFVRTIRERSGETVVISSEALDGLLRNSHYASSFFDQIRRLDLEPKLIVFVRNQSQSINSRYAQVVRSFSWSESFEAFVQAEMKHATFRYSYWIGLANAFDAELIPRALTRGTAARGVTAEFLRCIGITSLQFGNAEARRNETVGPFTVNVAREALRSIAKTGKPLKWLQATRCKKKLAAYLEEKGWADGGYCGLSTALARQIEAEFRPHNDAFAEAVWGRPWAGIFTADVTEEFTPNDFSISPPSWLKTRRLRQAIREIKETMREILADPALAVEAPWNDVMLRNGFVSP